MADAFDTLGTEQTPQSATAPAAQQAAPQGASTAVKAPAGDAFDTLGQEEKPQGQGSTPASAPESGNLLDQGMNAVGNTISHAAKASGLQAGADAVKEAIAGWHDPSRMMASVPASVKSAALAARDKAVNKMREMHAMVAEDQEASKNAQTLMKNGDLAGAAEMLSRHVAIRAGQAIENQPGTGIGMGMVKSIADPAIESFNKGDYSGAAGDIIGGVAPFLAGEGLGGEVTEASTAAKTATTGATAAAAAEDLAPGVFRPGVKTVADTAIPVRAEGTVAKAAESILPNARKAELQAFEAGKTQPAVRRAVSGVAADVADLSKAADTATKADPVGFAGTRDAIKARSKPVFEAIDKASEGAFSAAQAEADTARGTMDFEGKKAYKAAIQKQNDIFDSIKAMAGKGETPDLTADALDAAKADWKKAVGMDELSERFNKTVQPTPAHLLKDGDVDSGMLNPLQFRKAITKGIQEGEFAKAGFTTSHIQSLEELGQLLEKQHVKLNDPFTNILKTVGHTVIGSAIGSVVGGGIPGMAAGAAGEWGIGKALSKIMTSERAVKIVTQGLKTGAAPAGIADMLKSLWKDEEGSMKVPFQGGGAATAPAKEAEGMGAGEAVAKFGDDVANAARTTAKKDAGQEYRQNPAGLDEGNMHHAVTTTDEAGNKIGELQAQNTGNAKAGQVTVRSNQVYDPANRGKGIGKSQLQKLIDETSKDPSIKTLKSDISTTGGARGVWDSLMKEHPDAITKEMKGKGESAKPVWTVDLEKMREDMHPEPAAPTVDPQKAIEQEGAPVQRPQTPEERTPGRRVSQRVPTAVANTEDSVNGNLIIGKDAIDRAEAAKPGYKSKLAQRVADYPGVPITPEEAMANPDAALQKFTNHMANNLVWLHSQVPQKVREISKLWYDSAHELTKQWATKYDLAHEQMAGVVAALSPQNEWNNNVEVAKRVADIYKTKQDLPWSPEMETNASRILGRNPHLKALNEEVRGKKLSDLKEPEQKAWWIRLYDEAHNPRSHANYAPDGSIRGIARTPVGNQPSPTKWSSLDAIGKAVSIIEDGSQENIHKMLGDQHKIRNFYNNMIDPWSKSGDVTIDTHAVGAAHIRPMGGSAEEVLHNFGSSEKGRPGVPSSGHAGVNGTYGLYADAYRQAAAKLGILPRELQSITWEGIRSLFESHAKTPELKARIAQIWKEHKNGELTLDRARKQILKDAGGFKNPKWVSDLGQNGEAGPAAK